MVSVVTQGIDPVKHDQRLDGFALIAQLPVRIIFNDGDALLVRQPHQLCAPVFGQRDAARILEVGQGIHELWP